jgi:APA family basic amino acid/polyamine antiporter
MSVDPPGELRRSLGLRDASALVIGTVIGTGVFLKTAPMAQAVGSPLAVMVAWAVAGALSFTGALAYAELGAMFPHAGGEYVYLREAWGPLPGFLYGWTRFWIGTPGSIAAYAVGAATFADGLVPIGGGRVPVAIGLIALFTGLNCLTVAFGGRVQSMMTALKIAIVLGLAVLVIGAGGGQWSRLGGGTSDWGVSAFGAATLAALWATDGWNNLPMAAGEVRDPERNVPRALVVGMLVVLGLYALVNLAFFYALPLDAIVTSSSSAFKDAPPVATRAAETILGSAGVRVISVAFVLSALGAMNGSILTSARVPYAMARDKLFFAALGRVSPKTGVPVTAVIVQGAWACVLASSGSFDQLTDYVVFASWVFYALATAGVIALRIRRPEAVRRFKVPFYPWLPVVFILTSVALLAVTVANAPTQSAIGLGFIAAGVPAYLIARRSA